MPPPLQNYAGSDLEGTILRKLLQNQVLLALGTAGSVNGVGGVFPQVFADFRQYQQTYSASNSGAPAATATDYATLGGSASSLVYVTRVILSGFETTAAAIRIALIKRSAANTAGTSAAMTAVPHFSTDAAAGATALLYSANPTSLGAAIGNIDVRYVPVMATSTINQNGVVFDFGATGKPILLKDATELLAINLNGVTLTGGQLAARFEWYEI